MAETISIKIGDVTTTALMALPRKATAFPAVVVSHHKCGLDETTSRYVDILADAGFGAIAPNHYHVLPEGVSVDDRRAYLRDAQYKQDFIASIDWLKQHGADAKRLALLGHCAGGRTTWVGMEALPDVWRCGCVWYGGGIFQAYGDIATPFERLNLIACPVMGFFGNRDPMCTADHVNKTEAELKRLGKTCTFYRYDADHAFASYHDARYEEAPATDSWAKALTFLKANCA